MRNSTQRLNYNELELIPSDSGKSTLRKLSLRSVVDKISQLFVSILSRETELQVWQTCDRQGNTWWHAYDPATGKSIRLPDEAEMRIWIEQRYYRY